MKKVHYKTVAVRTWHLLFAGKVPEIDRNFSLVHWDNPSVDDYLSLYRRVGEQWGWTGRLLLSPDGLQQKLTDTTNEVWLFKKNERVLGFFEIDRSVNGQAEIVYFGLLPEQIGKGFGKPFLDAAIATASGSANDQVWLHTCEYDHPRALEIYLKAGFIIENETLEHEYYPVDFRGFAQL
jgi:hypothetical protein